MKSYRENSHGISYFLLIWNGTAYKTTGNLVKTDLVQNSRRRIVSKKKYLQGKKERKTKSRLFKKYTAKKGQFGPVKR